MGALYIGQGVVQFSVMTVLELKPVSGSNFGICHKYWARPTDPDMPNTLNKEAWSRMRELCSMSILYCSLFLLLCTVY